MTGKLKLYIGLLVVGLVMVGGGSWGLLNSPSKIEIPVILFTARADIFEMAKRFGANDYISKPLNPDHLVEKIKAVLGEKNSRATTTT